MSRSLRLVLLAVAVVGSQQLTGPQHRHKRQIFREQVLPLSGGKIPEEAFRSDRLALNRLNKEGIAVPDGVLLEARHHEAHFPSHRHDQDITDSIIKLIQKPDGRYAPPEGHYPFDNLIESTYVIRAPVSSRHFPHLPPQHAIQTTLRLPATPFFHAQDELLDYTNQIENAFFDHPGTRVWTGLGTLFHDGANRILRETSPGGRSKENSVNQIPSQTARSKKQYFIHGLSSHEQGGLRQGAVSQVSRRQGQHHRAESANRGFQTLQGHQSDSRSQVYAGQNGQSLIPHSSSGHNQGYLVHPQRPRIHPSVQQDHDARPSQKLPTRGGHVQVSGPSSHGPGHNGQISTLGAHQVGEGQSQPQRNSGQFSAQDSSVQSSIASTVHQPYAQQLASSFHPFPPNQMTQILFQTPDELQPTVAKVTAADQHFAQGYHNTHLGSTFSQSQSLQSTIGPTNTVLHTVHQTPQHFPVQPTHQTQVTNKDLFPQTTAAQSLPQIPAGVFSHGQVSGSLAQSSQQQRQPATQLPQQIYPKLTSIPQTPFTCQGSSAQMLPDLHTHCQVFHLCHDNGEKESFLCPAGLRFDPSSNQCSDWQSVSCPN